MREELRHVGMRSVVAVSGQSGRTIFMGCAIRRPEHLGRPLH